MMMTNNNEPTDSPIRKKRRPDSTLKKTASRVASVQALYELTQNPPNSMVGVDAIIADRSKRTYKISGKFDKPEDENEVPADPKMIRLIVEGAMLGGEVIDPLLRNNLPSEESMDRLGPMLLSILRAATFELAISKSAPYKVLIDEYSNITGAFLNDHEATLVTAVLDKVAKTCNL